MVLGTKDLCPGCPWWCEFEAWCREGSGLVFGPNDNDDRSVEERAEENEVIDLRDGAGWEADLPESND